MYFISMDEVPMEFSFLTQIENEHERDRSFRLENSTMLIEYDAMIDVIFNHDFNRSTSAR